LLLRRPLTAKTVGRARGTGGSMTPKMLDLDGLRPWDEGANAIDDAFQF